MKHTKGPWHIDTETREIVGPDDGEICSFNFTEDNDNFVADMNLVATAPDLLFILEQMLNLDECTLVEQEAILADAEAVIAKAKGGSQDAFERQTEQASYEYIYGSDEND